MAPNSPVKIHSVIKTNHLWFSFLLIRKLQPRNDSRNLKELVKSKTKIMASSPITSWEIDGETVETVSDFILLSSKITADGDCSQEIKRHLLLGKNYDQDSIFKSRDITLPIKVCLIKAIVFPAVMYGYESWTKKKAECWRIDAFKLWCWRRLWASLELQGVLSSQSLGNQSWIFIGKTDVEPGTPILWPPDAKNWRLWKDPNAGKDWRQEEKGTT